MLVRAPGCLTVPNRSLARQSHPRVDHRDAVRKWLDSDLVDRQGRLIENALEAVGVCLSDRSALMPPQPRDIHELCVILEK